MSCSPLPALCEARHGAPHQFWTGGEIPKGLTHLHMPQGGGQDRQARPHLCTRAIPLHPPLDPKAMAEIMEAWSLAGAWATPPNLPRHGIQGVADGYAIPT